ncbi:MAG TPA: HEAT repeat domain-containing protein [Gemmatimonadales bacterium]|nr:HEAT repeat domain-containing protein [Gemmatimonadales bacterium]
MFNHEIFAVSFGRALELTQSGAPVAERKTALSAVYALTSNASAMMRVYQDMLTVDDVGIPDSLPFVTGIIDRMRDHGVAEVAIGKGASAVELLALIRGLAADPRADGGIQKIKMRLRDAHSTAIMVIPLQSAEIDELHRNRSVTQAFEAEAIERAAAGDIVEEPPAPAPAPAQADAEFELPAMMNALDISLKRVSGERDSWSEVPKPPAPPVPPAAQPPAPAPRAPAAGAPPAGLDVAPLDGLTTAGQHLTGPVVMPGTDLPTLGLPVGPAKKSLSASLAEVAREPYGARILDVLTELFLGIQEALEAKQVEPAVHAMAAMIAWEPEAPAGSPRNSYRIVLQRLLTREHLEQVAPYVSDPRLGPEAIKVMQRGGAEAAVVLLARLVAADELKDRRSLVTALRGIPEGLDQVVHVLEHQQWFVVRNVAEAMGVQRVEEAVPNLVKCLAHNDARVRRAAAIALAKIGTSATVEPLRRVLKDGDKELRALIASSIGGHTSRALAMPLVAFAEQEQEADVLREYYRALGRIGTPEAVQALAVAAEPGGRLLGRRPTANRVAAVDGLRIAGGAGAVTALQALARDGDKAVREQVARALEELKARAASVGS